MGVIIDVDEYIVERDFSYGSAYFPDANGKLVSNMINFKKGERFGGYPAEQTEGMTIVVSMSDGHKIYLPIGFLKEHIKSTGRRLKADSSESYKKIFSDKLQGSKPNCPTLNDRKDLNSWFKR